MSHDLFGRNQLTRRDLMRLLGVSTGLIYVGPLAGCDQFWERQPVIPVDDWRKGVCRFCGINGSE
jgi:nitrate reductase NapA